jgi:hypothetical protein
MEQISINGRALLAHRPENVNAFLMSQGLGEFDKFSLVLDDGPHETTVQRVVYSTFCWNFQRIYDHAPLEKRHLLHGAMRITSTSHLRLMEHSYWDTFDVYNERGEELDLEYLDIIGCKSANAIYNYAADELLEWVETLSLDDYVDLVESPEIKKALEEVEPNRKSVAECHDKIAKLLLNAPDLAKNTLAEFCRSKFISMGQVLQCIAPKGYPTEIDSRYFQYPILNSFLTGLNTLYESASESRSATKAMYYSKDHVEKGEYFQRKMQLGTFPVARLFKGDCGATKYLQITMREDLLYAFAGKYMLTKDGSLKPIWKTSTELVGQTIMLRTTLHCNRWHEHGVCQKCFGYLGHSIVSGSNLGHITSSELCKDASQALLAVKHSDATVDVADISLGDLEQLYLTGVGDESESADLRLLHNDQLKGLRLAIEERYVKNIHDIKVVDDLSKLTLSNTTSIYSMQLWFTDEDGFDQAVRLVVANGSRMASLTLPALEYVRKAGWTITEDGTYVIDMKDWEYDDSLLSLPVQHANMLEYINDVETFSRSSGKGEGEGSRDRLTNYENLEQGLMLFNDLVSSKLSINIAHQEVVLSCMTARSTTDARFPRTPSEGVIMPYEELMRKRSLSGALAYEHLERIYGVPDTYLNQNRCYHPMDALLADLPEGVTVM